MAYIYCITNQINGKKYVGKTTYSVTKRFQEHCKDCKKLRCEKRPLYDAMNKYGVENFIIEQLLECDELELNSYEVLFIEQLNTYHNGYNATKGGDGSILFDYKQIVELYQSGLSVKEVATEVQCCVDTIRKVLHLYNIDLSKRSHEYQLKPDYKGPIRKPKRVIQLNKETNQEVQEFQSIADASHWLVDNGYAKKYSGGVRQKIQYCAEGKLKTAYKFKWKYPE